MLTNYVVRERDGSSDEIINFNDLVHKISENKSENVKTYCCSACKKITVFQLTISFTQIMYYYCSIFII